MFDDESRSLGLRIGELIEKEKPEIVQDALVNSLISFLAISSVDFEEAIEITLENIENKANRVKKYVEGLDDER